MRRHVKARDAGERICLIVIFLGSLFIFILLGCDSFKTPLSPEGQMLETEKSEVRPFGSILLLRA